MKKYLLSLFVLCLIVFAACAATKKGRHPGSGVTYVKMMRTPCFGKCPYYSLEIYSDGRIRYSGIKFTEHQGVYEKNVGAAKAREVLREFQTYRVDTCSAEYFNRITDIPGINYTVKMNGKSKEIRNAHFGPAFLKDLAKDMDKLGAVDNSWKKTFSTTGLE
jgi:hypothetical protein